MPRKRLDTDNRTAEVIRILEGKPEMAPQDPVEQPPVEPEMVPETPPEAPAAAEKPPEAPPPPVTSLAELAERLKAKPEDLYTVQIPLADGQTASLGELKDRYQASGKLDTDREALMADRREMAKAQAQARHEWDALYRAAGLQVTPELASKATELREYMRHQAVTELSVIHPDLKEPAKAAQASQAILEMVKPFGLTDGDLAQVLDARWLDMLIVLAEKSRHLQVKPEPVKPPKLANPAPSGPKGPSVGSLKKAVETKRMVPAMAVAELMKGYRQ